MTRLDRIEAELVADERTACAALCREAGCICVLLAALEDAETLMSLSFDGALDYHYSPPTVIRHDPRCPEALASRIEARGAVAPSENPHSVK